MEGHINHNGHMYVTYMKLGQIRVFLRIEFAAYKIRA